MPIWTGKKDDAEHPYQRYEVKATDLTHALKVAQDAYKAGKAAERAAAKDGVSLAGKHATWRPGRTRSQAMTPPSPLSREPGRISPSSTEERGDSSW